MMFLVLPVFQAAMAASTDGSYTSQEQLASVVRLPMLFLIKIDNVPKSVCRYECLSSVLVCLHGDTV